MTDREYHLENKTRSLERLEESRETVKSLGRKLSKVQGEGASSSAWRNSSTTNLLDAKGMIPIYPSHQTVRELILKLEKAKEALNIAETKWSALRRPDAQSRLS